MAVLNQEQQKRYFAEEGVKATPLSPIAWLQSQGASSPATPAPQPTPVVQNGMIDAKMIAPPSGVSMPVPTAPDIQMSFQRGIMSEVEQAKTHLDTTISKEKDLALKRVDELNAKLEGMMKESDPEKRQTFEQEQRIIQSQLNAAETAAASVEEDFVSRRKIVGELQTLLQEGNDLISKERNRFAPKGVAQASTARVMQDVQARAGVLQASISGLDGNITMAHSIINNTRQAVMSNWQDIVSYNTAYMKLIEGGKLRKAGVQDAFAEMEISLAQNKLTQIEKTSDYIKSLMVDPKSARFIADAGVSLTDSVEEVNTKIAEQTRREEVRDVVNDLSLDGYQQVPFGAGRTDLVSLEIGGETLYFKPPVEEVRGGGGGGGGGGAVGKPMTKTELDLFEEHFEWRPPFGISREQATELMQSRPDLTPDQLEREVLRAITGREPQITQATDADVVLSELPSTTKNALKQKAKQQGFTRFFGFASDIKDFINSPEIQNIIKQGLREGDDIPTIMEVIATS